MNAMFNFVSLLFSGMAAGLNSTTLPAPKGQPMPIDMGYPAPIQEETSVPVMEILPEPKGEVAKARLINLLTHPTIILDEEEADVLDATFTTRDTRRARAFAREHCCRACKARSNNYFCPHHAGRQTQGLLRKERATARAMKGEC